MRAETSIVPIDVIYDVPCILDEEAEKTQVQVMRRDDVGYAKSLANEGLKQVRSGVREHEPNDDPCNLCSISCTPQIKSMY